MFSKNFFTISDFAKISGVSRQTLIYYDRIGLFSPVKVGENKYRMYSHNQIGIISIISILTALGVPLKEIINIVKNISPETTEKVLSSQLNIVQTKIKELTLLNEMIELRLNQLLIGKQALKNNLPFSIIEIKEDNYFFVGKQINCSYEDISDDIMVDFFADCEKENIPSVYALGYIKKKENVLSKKENIISNICFRLRKKSKSNHTLPKGKYVIGFAKGDYGKTDYIYKNLFEFISNNNLKIVDDVYEEYLLDELAQKNPNEYIMQVSVRVE